MNEGFSEKQLHSCVGTPGIISLKRLLKLVCNDSEAVPSRGRGRPGVHICSPGGSPVLHRPQKNVISPIFPTNLRLEGPLPVYFSCATFCHSATTSATLWARKCATRRWTLRCSRYSVAKRQKFSCALTTATFSLTF